VYVTAYKGAGNERGMFDMTEICFTSLVQSSVGLSVCVGELPAKRLEVVPAIIRRTAYVRSAFCFGEDDERMPEEQVWSKGGRIAGTATVPSFFWWLISV